MAISSIGVGSGLNVTDIISKMVALEKQPLKGLQDKGQTIQTQISAYGQIKSLAGTLSSAVLNLTLDRSWNALSINSSNPAVTVTVSGQAQPAVYDIGVQRLSRAQTSVSDARPVDAKMGADGRLTIAQGGKSVPVDYTADDTLTTLAGKVNEQLGGNVIASVMRDASGKERLMLRSKDTGTAAAFTTDVLNTDGTAVDWSFSSDPATQAAQNALITINGVPQQSNTDTFDGVLPGLKITASQVTDAGKDARVSLAADKDATKKMIQDFIDAFNGLNDFLAKSTQSVRGLDGKAGTAQDDGTGLFQGDAATIGLQNTLRSLLGGSAGNASGAFKRLADIGIEFKGVPPDFKNPTLSIAKPDKLSKALESPEALRSLFAAKPSSDGSGGGIAVNFKAFTDRLMYGDALSSKTDSLELRAKNNLKDQDKVNQRAATLEARLTRQYTALDTQMASITALNTYMQNQIAAWNKSTK